MKLLIPAAGSGTRFRSRVVPKCLLPIGEETILSRLLRQANSLKLADVVIVVGFEAQKVEDYVSRCKHKWTFRSISFVYNPSYAESNSIHSLHLGLTQECAGNDTLIVDSDVILDEGMLQEFSSNVHGSALLLDTRKQHRDIDMKAEVCRGRIVGLSKTTPSDSTTGEFFGVSFFPDVQATNLARCCGDLVGTGGSHLWYEDAVSQLAKTTDIFSVELQGGHWWEVDTLDDYLAMHQQHWIFSRAVDAC